MLERLVNNGQSRILRGIFFSLLLLSTGCVSEQTVTLSRSYSTSEFTKISRNYHITVFTKSDGHFHVHYLRFKGDSVHFDGEKYEALQSKWNFPISQIQKIRLGRGPSWKLIGFLAGITIGITSSVLIFNHDYKHNAFPSYGVLSVFEIPPLSGILGLVIGNGFDKPDTYAGNYRPVPNGVAYRFQHIKNERQPPAQTNPAFK